MAEIVTIRFIKDLELVGIVVVSKGSVFQTTLDEEFPIKQGEAALAFTLKELLADGYIEIVDKPFEYSSTISSPVQVSVESEVEKCYWVRYKEQGKRTTQTCTTDHPFSFIASLNPKGMDDVELIDWKVISKKEYSLWSTLYPKGVGENELTNYEMD